MSPATPLATGLEAQLGLDAGRQVVKAPARLGILALRHAVLQRALADVEESPDALRADKDTPRAIYADAIGKVLSYRQNSNPYNFLSLEKARSRALPAWEGRLRRTHKRPVFGLWRPRRGVGGSSSFLA